MLSSGGSWLGGEGVQETFGGVGTSDGQPTSVRVQDTCTQGIAGNVMFGGWALCLGQAL